MKLNELYLLIGLPDGVVAQLNEYFIVKQI